MSNPHGSFIWYELMSKDADAAARFYGDVVGWTVGESMPGDVDYRLLSAADGFAGGLLALSPEMCAGGAAAGWFAYIGVDDVDTAFAAVIDDGGKAFMEPHDVPGVGRMAMVADPQGNAFYLMRGASDEASTAYGRCAVGHVSWNQLTTPDDAAALAFYARHFGIEKVGAMPMGAMGDYSFIANAESGGEAIGAVMRTPPGAPSGWSLYFRVPEITAAKAAVEAGGGTVFMGPDEVPGGDWIIEAADPEGVRFGLVSAAKEA